MAGAARQAITGTVPSRSDMTRNSRAQRVGEPTRTPRGRPYLNRGNREEKANPVKS